MNSLCGNKEEYEAPLVASTAGTVVTQNQLAKHTILMAGNKSLSIYLSALMSSDEDVSLVSWLKILFVQIQDYVEPKKLGYDQLRSYSSFNMNLQECALNDWFT